LCANKWIFVYKLDSFVGFIGDEIENVMKF
jgi:hypothetical protein